MTARVSTGGQTDLLIQQIFDQRKNIENIRNQISSGVRVPTPSADPGNSGAIVAFQNTSLRIDRHKNRIASATGFLDQQESVLNSTHDVLVRAKEIATQAANGSQSPESRALLAKEVWQLRSQVVSLANTTYQGQYIYGGADYGTAPYTASTYTNPASATLDAHFRYVFNASGSAGATLTRNVQVSDTDSIKLNTAANTVFDNAIAGLERLGRALDGYRTGVTPAVTGLPDGTGTAYTFPTDYPEQTNDILQAMNVIQNATSNDITIERSDVGSRLARLDQVGTILDNLKTSTETNRSALQDTDTIAAASQFSLLQTGLQALLSSGAQINQLSLLNYL